MDVVGGDARVAAQELAPILAHATVLHVVVFLLLLPFFLSLLFVFLLLLLGLPLHPLLLLGSQGQTQTQMEGRRRAVRPEARDRNRTPNS